jgi:hypothetical protein
MLVTLSGMTMLVRPSAKGILGPGDAKVGQSDAGEDKTIPGGPPRMSYDPHSATGGVTSGNRALVPKTEPPVAAVAAKLSGSGTPGQCSHLPPTCNQKQTYRYAHKQRALIRLRNGGNRRV